jgi:hypothetical protein
MAVRTIRELTQDVVDTMLRTRHIQCHSEDEYLEHVNQVLPGLLRLVVDFPDSAVRSCVRDVIEDIRAVREWSRLDRAVREEYQTNRIRPINPSTIANTLGSPHNPSNTTTEIRRHTWEPVRFGTLEEPEYVCTNCNERLQTSNVLGDTSECLDASQRKPGLTIRRTVKKHTIPEPVSPTRFEREPVI